MKIHMLVAHRNPSDTDEYGPEVCVAWDEYCVDENYQGFRDEIAEYKLKYPTSEKQHEYGVYGEITVTIDTDVVMGVLRPYAEVSGTVEGA